MALLSKLKPTCPVTGGEQRGLPLSICSQWCCTAFKLPVPRAGELRA